MAIKYKPPSANGYFGIGTKPAHKPWQPPVTRDYTVRREVPAAFRSLRLRRGKRSAVVTNGWLTNVAVTLVALAFVVSVAKLLGM